MSLAQMLYRVSFPASRPCPVHAASLRGHVMAGFTEDRRGRGPTGPLRCSAPLEQIVEHFTRQVPLARANSGGLMAGCWFRSS